jgi:hypothetical protein
MTFEEWWEAPKTVAQICASPKNIAQQAYQAGAAAEAKSLTLAYENGYHKGRDAMRQEAMKVCEEHYGEVANTISIGIGELK